MRNLSVLLLLSFGLLAAASAQSDSIRPTCPAFDSNEYYFPTGLFYSKKEHDDFVRNWYSKHLRVMSEPSLSCGPIKDSDDYRFTWLRSFHKPIAVRISRSKNEVYLKATELSGAGGYSPGEISRRVEKSVSEADWESVLKLLGKVDFWNLPTREERLGLDGAEWIFEGRQDGKYHIVDRWSPKDGPYHELGLLFLKLSGLSIPEKEIY
jgi:hypothetical protein